MARRKRKSAPKYKGSVLGQMRSARSVNPSKFGIKANTSRTVKVKGYTRGGKKVRGHTRSKRSR